MVNFPWTFENVENDKRPTYGVVEIDVVDGKLRDGSDNGGIVGTESGGKPEHVIFKRREKQKGKIIVNSSTIRTGRCIRRSGRHASCDRWDCSQRWTWKSR